MPTLDMGPGVAKRFLTIGVSNENAGACATFSRLYGIEITRLINNKPIIYIYDDLYKH